MSQPSHDQHDDHGHHGSRFIQHHYDDAQHQFDSGKLGIWFFLVQEILFFSALFVAYILYRHHRPEIYAYAHSYLDVKWGAINTAVLIVSSLSAAWAVRCAQLAQRRGLIACLVITIVCALGFLGIKTVEYTHKVHERILWGRYFDPCIAAAGNPLLNKGNNCPGVKTSVVWDSATNKAGAGCLDGDYDLDKRQDGIQAICEVAEVRAQTKVEYQDVADDKNPGKTKREAKYTTTELGRVAIAKCEPGKSAKPCWQLAVHPKICPTGPAAMVLYGDHTVRASVPTKSAGTGLRIEASCQAAPAAAAAAGDAFAPVEGGQGLGQGGLSTAPRKSAHDLKREFQSGPPPEHTNMFFSIYFAMTGLHGIHVLVGVFIFIWLLWRAIRGDFTPDYFGPIDYAALYWHLVDLIWIFLFPLLYLIH
jgi:cytochrome c oxidase subunit 3